MEMFWYLLGVLAVVLGVGISIALHELGHLIPAKKFGVKVTKYMIGFGPTLWSKKGRETEYGIKALPLGGYVSMIGMYPPKVPGGVVREDNTGFLQTMVDEAREASAETVQPGDEQRAFYSLPAWKKLVIMFGGPLSNLIIAIVLFAIVMLGFGAPVLTTSIASVNECVVADNVSRDECLPSDPAAPAAAAGVKPGDEIIRFNSVPVTSWAQFSELIRGTLHEVDMVVLRDGSELTLRITPLATERYQYDEAGLLVVDEQGVPILETVGFLGVVSQTERQSQPITAVIPAVTDNVVRVAQVILALPQRLVDVAVAAFGEGERDANGPISLVGVGRIAGEVAAQTQVAFVDRLAMILSIMASLNIALFVFNLIPLPPLDGGHIAGVVWEKIRRVWAKLRGKPDPGPVDTAKLVPVTMVVAVLLLITGALLIYADIVKPITLF